MLVTDLMNEWIGVTMDEPPFGSLATKDLGYAQRPVLVGQATNLAVLTFNRDEDGEVA